MDKKDTSRKKVTNCRYRPAVEILLVKKRLRGTDIVAKSIIFVGLQFQI
jgi:hypothetical protein